MTFSKHFDTCESTNALHNAWKLVKQLSGKNFKKKFIQGEDRLKTSDNTSASKNPVNLIYETNLSIDTDTFSLVEVNIAIKQIKLGKDP